MQFSLNITGDSPADLMSLLRSLSPDETIAAAPQAGTTTLQVKKDKQKPAPEAPKETPPPAATGEKLTLEQVRALCTAKAKSGKRVEVKNLLTMFGTASLDKLPEDQYPAFLEQLNVL